VDLGETYFQALGVEPRFSQDRALLERRFYEISRALHPDRFSTAGADARMASLERMSFVNQAYSTLKTPARLREYFLTLHGFRAEAPVEASKSQVPVELAEAWFEVQDALMEDPAEGQARLARFEAELQRRKQEGETELSRLERDYDACPRHEVLEKLHHLIRSMSYIKSMERDVERVKARAK